MRQQITSLLIIVLCLLAFDNQTVNATELEGSNYEMETYKHVTFHNEGCSDVHVYWWSGSNSGDVYYATISPNNSWSVNCYYGTMWNFYDTGAGNWMPMYTTGSYSYQNHDLHTSGCGQSCNAIISAVHVGHPSSCGATDGYLDVDPNVNGGTALPFEVYYTLDGVEQYGGGGYTDYSDNYVTGLGAGTYTDIKLVDANGCEVVKAGPYVLEDGCPPSAACAIVCPDDILELPCDPALPGAVVTWTPPTIPAGCESVTNCSGGQNIPGFIYLGEFQNSHYYCSSSTNYTWHQANDLCDNYGGYLVEINSPGENEYLRSNIMASSIWIGATDAQQEGDWRLASDGSPVGYTNWRQSSNEPNNYNGQEHYARLLRSTGEWTDRKYNIQYECVMEIPCTTTNATPIVQTAGPAPGDVFPSGITTVSYEYTDAYGVTHTCDFDVEVDVCNLPRDICDITDLNAVCGATIELDCDSVSFISDFDIFENPFPGEPDDTIFIYTVVVPELPTPTIEGGDCAPGTFTQVSGPMQNDSLIVLDEIPDTFTISYEYGEVGNVIATCDYTLIIPACGQENFSSRLGIQEATEISAIRAVPNPSTGLVNISFESEHALEAAITVHSAIGNEMSKMTTLAQKGTNNTQLDLSHLQAGLYYVQVQVRGVSKTVKVFITD